MTEDSALGLRVTQASMNQTAFDWPRNLTNIMRAIDKAVEEGSDILALEELALTGYEANDDFQRSDNKRILQALDDIAAYAAARDPNLIISIGHPWRVQMRDIGTDWERSKMALYDRLNLPFNVQTVIAGGNILGMTAKASLYNDERGYEKRYFNEWSMKDANDLGGKYGTIQIDLDDKGKRTIPFGRPIIHVKNETFAFNLAQSICEEKWHEDDNVIPSIAQYLNNTKDGLVLLIANASPPARDKIDRHVELAREASNYVDVVIDTDGLGSSGSTFAQMGHRLITQESKLVTQGKRMSYERVSTTTTNVQISNIKDKRLEDLCHVSVDHDFRNSHVEPENILQADLWDRPDNLDRHYEEVIRYTAFWLFDYMRKTGHKGVMEALSGGADSAFNCVIFSVMVHLGMKELGPKRFCEELNFDNTDEILAAYEDEGMDAAIKACMHKNLTTLYMGTNNSSDATLNAAKALADDIGAKFVNRNVQDLLDFYAVLYAIEDTTTIPAHKKDQMVKDIAAYLNASPYTTTPAERAEMERALRAKYPEIEELVTAADGVAYENIQARGRQVLTMLFANKENKIAIANPNLDEGRNAYATYGGDQHSGTINLNAHLNKDYQLGIMRYLYNHGLDGVMSPVKGLELVLKNKPSAELQPKGADGEVVQSDEAAMQRSFKQMDRISELMLYERIKTKNGARRLNASEVFEACQQDDLFAHVSENALYNMVRLSYVRWGIAQHKIHAAPIAPTFGRNVDHQTSLRTPNISGNSREELAELGLKLMFNWAANDNRNWSEIDQDLELRRSWQDEKFLEDFNAAVWKGGESLQYDLKQVYEYVNDNGWNNTFTPLPENHFTNIVHARRMAM